MDEAEYCLGVIPARAGSTRFPNKILAPILGKPMVQHVWEAARRAKRLNGVLVATDSPEIARAVEAFGGRAEMTSVSCPSGTDRVAEVARATDAGLVFNLQGDEPLLGSETIDALVEALASDPGADMATLAVPCEDPTLLVDPNVVKVVIDSRGHALYFSRQPLACGPGGRFLKHIGVYGYRRAALLELCALPPSRLEQVERLEQLRALEHGKTIRVAVVEDDTVAVDRPGDVALVEARLRAGKRTLGTPGGNS